MTRASERGPQDAPTQPTLTDRLRATVRLLRGEPWPARMAAAAGGTAVGMGGVLVSAWPLIAGDPQSSVIFAGLGACGGALGGFLMSGWLGRPGKAGAALSCLGAWLAGGLGGAIAGSLLAPGLGTVFGAMMGASLPVHSASTFVLWLGAVAILHFCVATIRRRTPE